MLINKWNDINKKNCIGIIMQMGLDKMPSIANYWNNSKLYNNNTPLYTSKSYYDNIDDSIKYLGGFLDKKLTLKERYC